MDTIINMIGVFCILVVGAKVFIVIMGGLSDTIEHHLKSKLERENNETRN